MCNFLFKNGETGEIRRAASFSLNSAARLIGLNVPYGRAGIRPGRNHSLPDPWIPWECWETPEECLWHYTPEGDCVSGPRKSEG